MPRNKQQTEQMRAESREKILTTARSLFAARGYDGCNVSDIAQAAGMSQGNIYWYFPSKKDIYAAVLEEGFTALGQMMAQSAAGIEPALEKFDRFLDSYLGIMKDKAGEEFFAIIMALANQGGGVHLSQYGLSNREIGAGYHQSLNAIFAQGQAEGVFLQGIDPDLLTTYFFSFMNGLMFMYPEEWQTFPEGLIRQAIQRLLGMSQK